MGAHLGNATDSAKRLDFREISGEPEDVYSEVPAGTSEYQPRTWSEVLEPNSSYSGRSALRGDSCTGNMMFLPGHSSVHHLNLFDQPG